MAVKVCPECKIESKALHMHMKTHEGNSVSPSMKGKVPSATNFVTLNDFEAFKTESNAKADQILSILLAKGKEESLPDEPDDDPIIHSETTVSEIPKEHEEIFSKYFDRKDGFDAEIDILESTFSIIVPPKFSNASPAHAKFYQVDKRLIKMDNNNPLGTVEEYCMRVAKNLRYDRAIKTK